MVVIERCGHAYQYSRDVSTGREVGRRPQASVARHLSDLGGTDVTDVALASIDRVDLNGVDIEARHAHSRATELQRQWKADVSHAYNRDPVVVEFRRHTLVSLSWE